VALIGAGEPGDSDSDGGSPGAVLGRGLQQSATANGYRRDSGGESSDEGGSQASDQQRQLDVSAGGAASSGEEDSDDAAADDADAAVARMMAAAAGGRDLDATAQLASPATDGNAAAGESPEEEDNHIRQPPSAAGERLTSLTLTPHFFGHLDDSAGAAHPRPAAMAAAGIYHTDVVASQHQLILLS
jgi:hypothetical protein